MFALANGGVDLRGDVLAAAVSSPLTWAVVAGLVVGKPLGIAGVTLASVRRRLGRLPRGMTHTQVLGGATLSGIGFTVSLRSSSSGSTRRSSGSRPRSAC